MDQERAQAYENLTKAVALLTAWNISNDLVAPTVSAYVEEDLASVDPVGSLCSMVSGLVTLSGRLLLEVSNHTGRSTDEVLEVLGRRAAEGS